MHLKFCTPLSIIHGWPCEELEFCKLSEIRINVKRVKLPILMKSTKSTECSWLEKQKATSSMKKIRNKGKGWGTLVGDRGEFYWSEWEWIHKTSLEYESKKRAFGLFSKPCTFDNAKTSKRTVMKPICHLTHAELATKVTYIFFRHSHSLQSDSPRSLLNKPTSVTQ